MENLGDILKKLADNNNISEEDSVGITPRSSIEKPTECDTCRDRGWYTRDVPIGHVEFGEVVNCECQHNKLEKEQTSRLLRYSNLENMTRFKFQTLNIHGQNEDQESQKLFQDASIAAEQYSERPQGWLVFNGPHGSGKTHLAAAIGNRLIERGHLAFFVNVPDLIDHLRASFGPSSEMSYSDLFEQVKNSPVLILDGMETSINSSWAEEKLRQIINHRYNAELPTVITLSGHLGDLDPYLLSRMQSQELSRIININGPQQEHTKQLGMVQPEMLRRMTFETFNLKSQKGHHLSPEQKNSLKAAFEFARNYAVDPDGWLTLLGETGVGKTHLAVAIAGEQIKQGKSVFFFFVPEFLDYLRHSFNPDSKLTYDSLFQEVKTCPLLILDDLGQEHSSLWAQDKLYQIIVHRHNSRLPTIITSLMDFTKDEGPIASRIQDQLGGEMYKIDSKDYRRRST